MKWHLELNIEYWSRKIACCGPTKNWGIFHRTWHLELKLLIEQNWVLKLFIIDAGDETYNSKMCQILREKKGIFDSNFQN